SGIARAPRGVPQIEVTFNIDSNGIVKVSAKDLGTGKEANISITASTNLSQDDIEKAVRDAEQYAAEDKARKDEVDTRNTADQIIYQTEKTLGELEGKISAEDKASIQSAVDHLKEVSKGSDIQAIKDATDAVQKAFYAVSEKMYQAAGAAQGAEGAGYSAPGNDDGVVDADYETVD
ncbi:MAG: Hsp70 family protein, partial [Oscillospiraceae bacterium]|nr:Hsp70 family protein [Oscillospiraceae bacterium]